MQLSQTLHDLRQCVACACSCKRVAALRLPAALHSHLFSGMTELSFAEADINSTQDIKNNLNNNNTNNFYYL